MTYNLKAIKIKETISHLKDAKQHYKDYETKVMKDVHLHINDERLSQFIHDFLHMHSSIQAIDRYSDVIIKWGEWIMGKDYENTCP